MERAVDIARPDPYGGKSQEHLDKFFRQLETVFETKASVYRTDQLKCTYAAGEPDPPRSKRHYCWALVGHNFKSDITYFYNVPGNSNGKMSRQVYFDSILEPIVKPWIERGDDVVCWKKTATQVMAPA